MSLTHPAHGCIIFRITHSSSLLPSETFRGLDLGGGNSSPAQPPQLSSPPAPDMYIFPHCIKTHKRLVNLADGSRGQRWLTVVSDQGSSFLLPVLRISACPRPAQAFLGGMNVCSALEVLLIKILYGVPTQ